jgi:hypothetical protein
MYFSVMWMWVNANGFITFFLLLKAYNT